MVAMHPSAPFQCPHVKQKRQIPEIRLACQSEVHERPHFSMAEKRRERVVGDGIYFWLFSIKIVVLLCPLQRASTFTGTLGIPPVRHGDPIGLK